MAGIPAAYLDAIDQICAAITAVLPQVHAAQVSSVVKKDQSPKIAVKASPRVTARATQKQKQSSTVAVKASKERIPVKAAPAVLKERLAVKAAPAVFKERIAVKALKRRVGLPVKAAPAVLRAISDILKAAPRAKEAVSMDPAWEYTRSR